MPSRSLIVLSFDALATSPLGPYGCSWLDTPGFNRLASESTLFDRCIASTTDPAAVLAKYFDAFQTSNQESRSAAPGQPSPTTLLFTDVRSVAQSVAAQGFDECTLLCDSLEEDETPPTEIASSIEETMLARLMAAATTRRENLGDTPHVIWVHYSGLSHRWDAPHALRDADDLYDGEDEGDGAYELDSDTEAMLEAARQSTTPPRQLYSSSVDDPDLLLAWMTAYGAQVRTIDAMLEVWLDLLENDFSTSLAVLSTGGFTLGENGWIGPDVGPVRSPRIQLPLIIRDPNRGPIRLVRPVCAARVGRTLSELLVPTTQPHTESLWNEVSPKRWAQESDPLQPTIETHVFDSHNTIVRTSPGWFYVKDEDGSQALFLKPDDRSDANDIAKLKSDVVEYFETVGD